MDENFWWMIAFMIFGLLILGIVAFSGTPVPDHDPRPTPIVITIRPMGDNDITHATRVWWSGSPDPIEFMVPVAGYYTIEMQLQKGD